MPVTPFIERSFERAIEQLEARVEEQTTSGGGNAGLTLADARSLIARAHGFDSWPVFTRQLEGSLQPGDEGHEFELAADAVVQGDVSTLQKKLETSPGLVRIRSNRSHGATLLHYVAANGVEDFRQLSPPNAVAIARLLLEAGSDVDAVANTYGGGTDQTTMNLLVSSVHPAAAGVQSGLVNALLDFGAAVDGLDADGSPLMTALAFGYSEAAETLARRGARVDTVAAAAALGREDLVRRFVVDNNKLSDDVRAFETDWLTLSGDAKEQTGMALVWACRFGRIGVAEYLLQIGVDPAASDSDDMTALHWASASGSLEITDLLLRRGARLEATNKWGGTVLSSTIYFAVQGSVVPRVSEARYVKIIKRLIAAGADVGAAWRTGINGIDEVLTRHGLNASSSSSPEQ